MTVTTPAGFTAAGVPAGLKASGGKDVALVVNQGPAFDSATAPRGALPNFCGIGGPDRSITLEQDELAEDADIHVFDDTFDDPCFGGP